MDILKVDKKFQQPMSFKYPPHNDLLIEEEVHRYFEKSYARVKLPFVYLPIYWTSWHCNNGFGKAKDELQEYYNDILTKNPDKIFFTVVQYDDGTMIDDPRLVKFACAHKSGLPVPYLVSKHPCEYMERTQLASFTGNLESHFVRYKMATTLEGNPDFVITKSEGLEEFRDYMCSSYFALCPRGYGLSSFRLYEAMQMGAVPVIIHDGNPHLPFESEVKWKQMAVIIHEREMYKLISLLPYLVDAGWWKRMQIEGKFFSDWHCNTHSVCQYIMKVMEGLC